MPTMKKAMSLFGIKGVEGAVDIVDGVETFEDRKITDLLPILGQLALRTLLQHSNMIEVTNNNPSLQLQTVTASISEVQLVTWLIGMIPVKISGGVSQDIVFRVNRIIDVVMKSVIQKVIDIPIDKSWEGDIHIVLPPHQDKENRM